MERNRRAIIEEIYGLLHDAFGPQYWWPADTPFEVIIGAILTQNTAWKNVVLSINVLKGHGLIQCEALHALPVGELAPLIRSSGYFNQKSNKIKAFCSHLHERWKGNLAAFLDQETDTLRRELLGLHGIGPETADSIVLYAAHKPSFVVDAYTRRIFSRHGLVPPDIAYEPLRAFFMESLPPDVPFFQEMHALLVRVGHLYCRRSAARCASCPLKACTAPPI